MMKMNKLGIDAKNYNTKVTENTDKNSFVLINPSFDVSLQSGDIIYLLKPGNKFSKKVQKTLESSILSIETNATTNNEHYEENRNERPFLYTKNRHHLNKKLFFNKNPEKKDVLL